MTPRWMKLLFVMAMCGTLVGWAWTLPKRMKIATKKQNQSKGPARVGKLAPSFRLLTHNGEAVKLSNYRGKWVLLNFWATWCPPCRREMPSMEQLARQMKGKNFRLLAVSVDSNWRIIRRFFQKHPKLKNQSLQMQLLWDKNAVAASRFGTTKYPETYLIAPNGTIKLKFVGERKWDHPKMIALLKKMMK